MDLAAHFEREALVTWFRSLGEARPVKMCLRGPRRLALATHAGADGHGCSIKKSPPGRHGPLLRPPRPAQVVDIDTGTTPLSALYARQINYDVCVVHKWCKLCEARPPSPPPEPEPPCIEIVLKIKVAGAGNSELWSELSVDGDVDCRPSGLCKALDAFDDA